MSAPQGVAGLVILLEVSEVTVVQDEKLLQGDFFYDDIQHCFICRLSDSTVSEDAGIEPRTVATMALAVKRSIHSARSHLHNWLDLIHNRLDLIHTRLDLIHKIEGYVSSAHICNIGNFSPTTSL